MHTKLENTRDQHIMTIRKQMGERFSEKDDFPSIVELWEAISTFVYRHANGYLIVKEGVVGVSNESLLNLYTFCEEAKHEVVHYLKKI